MPTSVFALAALLATAAAGADDAVTETRVEQWTRLRREKARSIRKLMKKRLRAEARTAGRRPS